MPPAVARPGRRKGGVSRTQWLALLALTPLMGLPCALACEMDASSCNQLKVQLSSELSAAGFHLQVRGRPGCAHGHRAPPIPLADGELVHASPPGKGSGLGTGNNFPAPSSLRPGALQVVSCSRGYATNDAYKNY